MLVVANSNATALSKTVAMLDRTVNCADHCSASDIVDPSPVAYDTQ